MTRDLKCFDPNSIELCIFCGLYFDFVLSPVFKYKGFSGRFIVPHLGNFPRSDFPGSHREKKTGLFCFERAHYKVLYFFYVFTLRGVCKPSNEPETSGDWTHKYQKTALSVITRFLYWTFLYSLYLPMEVFFRDLIVCFDILWQAATTDARDNSRESYANSSR